MQPYASLRKMEFCFDIAKQGGRKRLPNLNFRQNFL